MEFIMRTNTVTGVILGLLMVFAGPSQAQESNENEIDCSQLTTTLQIELCEERWDEEEIRLLIRDEINNLNNFETIMEAIRHEIDDKIKEHHISDWRSHGQYET